MIGIRKVLCLGEPRIQKKAPRIFEDSRGCETKDKALIKQHLSSELQFKKLRVKIPENSSKHKHLAQSIVDAIRFQRAHTLFQMPCGEGSGSSSRGEGSCLAGLLYFFPKGAFSMFSSSLLQKEISTCHYKKPALSHPPKVPVPFKFPIGATEASPELELTHRSRKAE